MNTSATITFFGSILKEIPQEVTQLASDLHNQRTQEITVDVLLPISYSPEVIDNIYYIECNRLIFTSIAARNHCTAVNSFRKFENSDVPIVDTQKIFDEAHQLWTQEIGHVDFACGRFLGLISQNMDVLSAGIEVVNNSEVNNVFNVLRNVGNALPFLSEVNIQKLVDLVEAQHPKTSRNLAALIFFNQVIDYLSAHPVLSKELYALVRKNLSDANSKLYDAALIGIAKAGQARDAIKFALDDADSEHNDLVASALWILGHLVPYWENEPDLKNHVHEVLKAMSHHLDSNINRQALQALSNAATSQPELIDELLIHAQPSNQIALQVLSSFAFMNFEIIKSHLKLAEILRALAHLDIGLTNDFDYVLSRLIENNIHDELVYSSLTTWVVKNYNKTVGENLISCFSQSLMALINKPLLNIFITRWIVSDTQILGAAYADLLGHLWVHGIKQPVFAKSVLDTLNQEDFVYLVRRLLGWTFYEEPTISLTFSLLETDDAQQRTFSLVHGLLTNDIGRNYPDATLKTIREKINCGVALDVENLLKVTQSKLIAYTEAIKKLPERHELRPPIPMRIRHTTALKKSKETREAMEKSHENSIATRIHIKAGTGSFSINNGQISSANRLNLFSSFISLPMQCVIDPLNHEITSLGFRVAKRGDE